MKINFYLNTFSNNALSPGMKPEPSMLAYMGPYIAQQFPVEMFLT